MKISHQFVNQILGPISEPSEISTKDLVDKYKVVSALEEQLSRGRPTILGLLPAIASGVLPAFAAPMPAFTGRVLGSMVADVLSNLGDRVHDLALESAKDLNFKETLDLYRAGNKLKERAAAIRHTSAQNKTIDELVGRIINASRGLHGYQLGRALALSDPTSAMINIANLGLSFLPYAIGYPEVTATEVLPELLVPTATGAAGFLLSKLFPAWAIRGLDVPVNVLPRWREVNEAKKRMKEEIKNRICKNNPKSPICRKLS